MSPFIEDRRRSQESQGDFDHIPVIDVSALKSSNYNDLEKLAVEIYNACTDVGFFYIKNHTVSEELIQELQDAARDFFALPEEKKMKYFLGKSRKFRGFMPLFAEQSTGSGLNEPGEMSGKGAFSEAFDIGYELSGDYRHRNNEALPNDTYDLYGDNQWPDDNVLPHFRETYLRYFSEMLELSRKLIRVFALALDLDIDFFDNKVNYPGVTSRMLHYPPQPVREQQMEGLGAHTDYECFTILLQDEQPGLQVRNAQGEWILAPPIPGALVVNIGDCLSLWTNKKFKSTIHRVTNISGQERYSIPFFFGVDYATEISVLPNCVSEDEPPCSEPFEAGEFVRGKLTKAYVGFGDNAIKAQ